MTVTTQERCLQESFYMFNEIVKKCRESDRYVPKTDVTDLDRKIRASIEKRRNTLFEFSYSERYQDRLTLRYKGNGYQNSIEILLTASVEFEFKRTVQTYYRWFSEDMNIPDFTLDEIESRLIFQKEKENIGEMTKEGALMTEAFEAAEKGEIYVLKNTLTKLVKEMTNSTVQIVDLKTHLRGFSFGLRIPSGEIRQLNLIVEEGINPAIKMIENEIRSTSVKESNFFSNPGTKTGTRGKVRKENVHDSLRGSYRNNKDFWGVVNEGLTEILVNPMSNLDFSPEEIHAFETVVETAKRRLKKL